MKCREKACRSICPVANRGARFALPELSKVKFKGNRRTICDSLLNTIKAIQEYPNGGIRGIYTPCKYLKGRMIYIQITKKG